MPLPISSARAKAQAGCQTGAPGQTASAARRRAFAKLQRDADAVEIGEDAALQRGRNGRRGGGGQQAVEAGGVFGALNIGAHPQSFLFVLQVIQPDPKRAPPPRQQRFQGFNADPENLRRFNIAASLIMTELDGGALPLRQGRERGFDLHGKRGVLQGGVGAGGGIGNFGRLFQPCGGGGGAAGRSTCSG